MKGEKIARKIRMDTGGFWITFILRLVCSFIKNAKSFWRLGRRKSDSFGIRMLDLWWWVQWAFSLQVPQLDLIHGDAFMNPNGQQGQLKDYKTHHHSQLNGHWTNLLFLMVVPPGLGWDKLRHCTASSHAVSVLWINRELQSPLASMDSLPLVLWVHNNHKDTHTRHKTTARNGQLSIQGSLKTERQVHEMTLLRNPEMYLQKQQETGFDGPSRIQRLVNCHGCKILKT